MAKKGKSAVNESFKQGFGSEMGKRFAVFICAVIAALALGAWAIFKDSDSTNIIPTINKSNSQSNTTQ